jgi:hypothetical protein
MLVSRTIKQQQNPGLLGGRHRAPIYALMLAQFVYLMAGITQVVNAYDEGFVLYGASRILNGDVPYKDFWLVYTPGQFYAVAGLFAMFGESVLTERIWDTIARLSLVIGVYLVAAALSPPKIAIIPSIVVTIWLGPVEYYGYAVFPSLSFSIFGAFCLLKYISSGQLYWLIASGLAVGMAIIFRHDIGFYAFICIGLTCTAIAFTNIPEKGRYSPRLIIKALDVPLVVAISAMAPVIPVILYLIRAVPVDTLWNDLVVYPLALNRQISHLAYPPLLPDYLPIITDGLSVSDYVRDVVEPWLRFYAPLLVYLLAPVLLFMSRRCDDARRNYVKSFGAFLLVLLGLSFFNHALNRFDRLHALPASIVAIILLVVALYSVQRAKLLKKFPAILSIWLLVPSIFYVIAPMRTYSAIVEAFPPLSCHSELRRAGCADLYPDQEQAIAYVQERTPSDERIFVGTTRHDRVVASDIIFYFLAERHSATEYHELVSGVATTLEVQREIVNDLEAYQVRYIVLSDAFDGVIEPNASALSSGITLLDDFIRGNYRVVERFGVYTIWQKQ